MLPLPRLILLHQQKTSGRVRFLCLASGVVAFSPLPETAALHAEAYDPPLRCHPAAVLREAEARLGLPEGAIEPEAEFSAWVDTAAGDVPVLIGRFAGVDPPFAAAERSGGRFIALTDARGLSEVERNLLRRAYEHVLG